MKHSIVTVCSRKMVTVDTPMLSPILDCSCGAEFMSACSGVETYGEGEPPLGFANCPVCGSTRVFFVRPEQEGLGDALWKARRFAETFGRVVFVTDSKPHRFLSRRPRTGVCYEVRPSRSQR